MQETVNKLKESRDVALAKAILEDAGYTITKLEESSEEESINEAYPPILKKLSKYDQIEVKDRLHKLGVDIENTPYDLVTITSARDPLLKDPNVLLIFVVSGRPVVVHNRNILTNPWLSANINVKNISWTELINASTEIYAMKFDSEVNQAMKDKRAARKEAQQGQVVRYTGKDKPRYRRVDKSGYLIDPEKYKNMLAELQIPKANEILEQAKDVYTQLASKINDIDLEDWRASDDYDTVMRNMISKFRDLKKYLREYNENKDEETTDTWKEYQRDNVISAIKQLKSLVTLGKKYLD